jgi:hypothetical protein
MLRLENREICGHADDNDSLVPTAPQRANNKRRKELGA